MKNLQCKSQCKYEGVTTWGLWSKDLIPPGIKKHLMSKPKFYELRSLNFFNLTTRLVSLQTGGLHEVYPQRVMQRALTMVILEEMPGKLPTSEKEKRKTLKGRSMHF